MEVNETSKSVGTSSDIGVLYSFESPKYLPVLTSLMKDADSVRAAVLIPFKLVKTFAFRPKMNLMKKFWTFSCRTKYIHSLLIGPKP